jgi:hypothetical protein
MATTLLASGLFLLPVASKLAKWRQSGGPSLGSEEGVV